MKVHCLFEQSGTFRDVFREIGITAYDYDIQNEYKTTDIQIDLFKEIENAYNNEQSIFDKFQEDDIIFAFFPCTFFETQQNLFFTGKSYNMQRDAWSDLQKIEYCMQRHLSVARNYNIFCKLYAIAIKRNLQMIIENPWSHDHYLLRYFPISPKLIDYNRRELGDTMRKPTQYYFVNRDPNCFLFMQAMRAAKPRTVNSKHYGKLRSEISAEYARNFVFTFILEHPNT